MPAYCLQPIGKCAYKKEQQSKEEAFQDGDITDKSITDFPAEIHWIIHES